MCISGYPSKKTKIEKPDFCALFLQEKYTELGFVEFEETFN